jgi:hypothetical protein
MKRFILAPLAALLGLLALDSSASAQFTYPLQGAQRYPGWHTPLSPYLNLLRGGDPAANYYIGVLPEFQRRQDRGAIYSSLQGLANQLPPRPGAVERDIDEPLRSTGHPVAFGYTGGYFGGPTGMTRPTSNPFPQRQAGPKNQWPRTNKSQSPGAPPKKLQ